MTITAPAAQPTQAWVLHSHQTDMRDARDHETALMVRRPQIPSGRFAVYTRGHYIRTPSGLHLIVAVGRPHTVTIGYMREWRQALVVRVPTAPEAAIITGYEDIARAARVSPNA